MSERTLYYVGQYNNPVNEDDRDRTIASFYVAQDTRVLGTGEMRRDVLTYLNGPTMVNHWLNTTKRLEVVRKVGRVTYLRLTAAGFNACHGKLRPTANIDLWMKQMTGGGPGTDGEKTFSLT